MKHRDDPMARAGNDLAGTLFDGLAGGGQRADGGEDGVDRPPAARRSLPATSREAWEGKKKTLNESEMRVLRALREFGPMAIFQVGEKLGVQPHTISGRFGAKGGLEEAGLIQRLKDKFAKTSAGYRAEMWSLTAAGLEAVQAATSEAA